MGLYKKKLHQTTYSTTAIGNQKRKFPFTKKKNDLKCIFFFSYLGNKCRRYEVLNKILVMNIQKYVGSFYCHKIYTIVESS